MIGNGLRIDQLFLTICSIAVTDIGEIDMTPAHMALNADFVMQMMRTSILAGTQPSHSKLTEIALESLV